MSKKKSYWQQDIKTKEYALAAVEGIFVICVTAYLFYASLWAAAVLSPGSIWYYRRWKRERTRKKKREFRTQFRDALEALASSLGVGYSMENAIKEVKKEMQVMYPEKSPVVREFAYMARQLNLNMTAEQAWRDLAARTELEEVQGFVTVFTLAKRNGGDSIAVIRNAVRQIGDKMDVEREIDTILSAKKLEFRVMCVIPLGIVAYMRVSFPEFMQVLYGNAAGILLMSVCLLSYLAAVRLGQKIITIEV